MTLQAELSEQQRIAHLVHEIEMLRLKRKRTYQRHPEGKRFSQDELGNMAYPSYKNMLLARTQRLPDRAALMQIADYLECTPMERNALLRAAQYAPESLLDVQRRKQTTILIGNIFVTSPTSLDVEDAADALRSLWERLEGIIIAHRGIIGERTGNILLALWSTETTSENDPEQAVRAALAMQADLHALSAEWRFGIHTGQVLLQTTEKYGQIQAAGETVNIASHLSHLSPPNSILISHATYSHLRAIFDVSVLDIPASMPLYCVSRLSPVAEPILLHASQELDTPMIGRANELTFLQDAFLSVRETGQQQIITLMAEAGVGKSRLLYEFDEWLCGSAYAPFSFKGRASQSSQEIPYSLLRSMLSFRFQITDDDISDIARQKIEFGFAEVFQNAEDAQKAAHLVSHLLSFNLSDSPYVRDAATDAQEFFEMALAHLSDYVKAIADDHVVVMLLEDIHWADASSLSMLKRLSILLVGCPILIVCTARPDQPGPHAYFGQLPHKTLKLRPLSQQDSYAMLNELLVNVGSISETASEMIISSSSGNPLYIEELVKMLRENGTLFRKAEQWAINNELLLNIQVPTTLTALLQARFDNLPASQQLVLQFASIFGRFFWDGSVKALLGNDPQAPRLVSLIDELCTQKMIFRQKKSTFRGYTEYTFKHALLSDVIYETILKQNRLSYHAAAADWLMTVAARNQRLDEYAGLIAYHFKRADVPEEASKWYWRAGKAAAARFANTEALDYISCSLDLLPATQEVDRYALWATRERVFDALGMREEQSADLNAMFNIAVTMGDIHLQVETIVRQTNYAYLMGKDDEVAQLAKNAIQLAATIGAYDYQASSYVMLGNLLWNQGKYETAHTCFEHALRLTSLPTATQT